MRAITIEIFKCTWQKIIIPDCFHFLHKEKESLSFRNFENQVILMIRVLLKN